MTVGTALMSQPRVVRGLAGKPGWHGWEKANYEDMPWGRGAAQTLQLSTWVALSRLLKLSGLCTFHLQSGDNKSTHITA